MAYIGFKLPPEDKKRLKEIAKALNTTLSEIGRQLINEYIMEVYKNEL